MTQLRGVCLSEAATYIHGRWLRAHKWKNSPTFTQFFTLLMNKHVLDLMKSCKKKKLKKTFIEFINRTEILPFISVEQ